MYRISGCTEQRPPNPLISFLLVAHHGQQGSASHGARKRKSQRRGRPAAGSVVGRAGQGGSAGGGSPPGRDRWRREGRATRGQQRPRPPTGQGLAERRSSGRSSPLPVEETARLQATPAREEPRGRGAEPPRERIWIRRGGTRRRRRRWGRRPARIHPEEQEKGGQRMRTPG